MGASIAARQPVVVNSAPLVGQNGAIIADSLGQMYSVELRTGTTFIGTLVARRQLRYYRYYLGGAAGAGAARLRPELNLLGVLYGTDLGGIYPAYLEVAYRFGKVK